MKTTLNTFIDEMQLYLNGLGVMQYNSTTKIEKAVDNAKMQTLKFCIDEAKKLIELEKKNNDTLST